MRHLFARILIVVCLAAPFAGQAEQWQRYKNAEGNFSVLMPGTPKDSPNGDQSAQISHTIQAISGSIGYTVVYVVNKADQPVNEATYKIYRDAFLKGLPNCKLVTENPASPAMRGYIGRWYRMKCQVQDKDMTFVGNLYWGRRHAYAVLTMFQTAPSEPATGARFINSFTALDAGN